MGSHLLVYPTEEVGVVFKHPDRLHIECECSLRLYLRDQLTDLRQGGHVVEAGAKERGHGPTPTSAFSLLQCLR